MGGTASRLLSGQTEGWRKLEEEFARFAGTEAALFFGSGYAANMGLLSSLVGPDDVVYSDVLNHASLIDGMRLSGARKVIYPHLDLSALENSLRQDAGAPWRRIIVTESVFSMNGDVAPLQEMATLAERFGAAMIVDEAHATGVQGKGGNGLAAEAAILPHVLATIHTCGKALAIRGSLCVRTGGDEGASDQSRADIYFQYGTAAIFCGANRRGAETGKRKWMLSGKTLLKRAKSLIHELRRAGFDTAGSASQIVPVVIGKQRGNLGGRGTLATKRICGKSDPAADSAGGRSALASFAYDANRGRGTIAAGEVAGGMARG